MIIDLHLRAMIGGLMSNLMAAQLACDAMTIALFCRGFPKNVIVYSDRGSQYCSHVYRELIEKYQLIQCMSQKACWWENACAENFFHSLRVEAIQYKPIIDWETMKKILFGYKKVNYSKTRRHVHMTI